MKTKQITEATIIDVIMGQATPDIESQVNLAIQSDEEIAALYDFWMNQMPALKEERKQAEAFAEAACDKVMTRLNECPKPQDSPIPTSWFAHLSWKTAMPAVACICVVLFCFSKFNHKVDQQIAPNHTNTTKYVDFQYVNGNRVGSANMPYGTESRPYNSLSKALDSVAQGGTIIIKGGIETASARETLRITKPTRIETKGTLRAAGVGETFRITKPMRIESKGGNARIGVS